MDEMIMSEDIVAARTQEIYNPVVARLRAFSWPKSKEKSKNFLRDKIEAMSNDDLLDFIAECETAFDLGSEKGKARQRCIKFNAEAVADAIKAGQTTVEEIYSEYVIEAGDNKNKHPYALSSFKRLVSFRLGCSEAAYKMAQGELQKRYIAQLARDVPEWGAWGGPTCILDTETQDVQTGQAMRFGVAQMRGYGYRELIEIEQCDGAYPDRDGLDALREVYFFYDIDMIETDRTRAQQSIAILEDVCRYREKEASEKHGRNIPHKLITRDEFVEDIIFKNERIKGDIPFPTLIIGHKLDFDIERLPVFNAGMARGEFFYGGFSLPMGRSVRTSGKQKGEPDGPRVQLKKLGPGKFAYRCVSPYNGRLQTHLFVDTLMLARALLGAEVPGSMASLCKMFGSPIPKEKLKHFEPLTRDYVNYCYNDVERTWFLYEQLRAIYLKHGRTTPVWKMYSVASTGKAYYVDFGIKKYLEKNVEKANAAHQRKSLMLCGVSMEAMVGARAECGIRHQIREVIAPDFKSQYPTNNIKLGLQDLLLAERVDVVEDERTASGAWLRGGEDALFLETIHILDSDDGASFDTTLKYAFGSQALLGKDKILSDAIWRRLCGFALIDPAGCVLPLRTSFQEIADEDDGNASINVGLAEVALGPPMWVSYLDVLSSKFLTGRMPRVLATKRMEPVGRQKHLGKINFFGDPDYTIDLTNTEVNIFKRVLEMRDQIKAAMKKLAVGSPEHTRLDMMQMALKLIANSTSYGVFVQFDTDEREKETAVVILHGTERYGIVARQRTRGADGKKKTSPIKVEKPGQWFAPWGPLITAGGRLLLAIAQALARYEGAAYGGIPHAICDTDSFPFARPLAMPRNEFRAGVARICGYFQRINPYAPVNGKEPEVFAIEDVNFEFTNENGEFKKGKRLKPLYILAISAKRYAMANIIRPCARSGVTRDDAAGWFPNSICVMDWSDYDDLAEIHADWKNARVILRKVSAHALGPITAPGYKRPPDDRAHLSVPYEYDNKGELQLDENGKPIPLYGAVCKGKGNARLYLDMWKYAFEMFVKHENKMTGREIARMIETDMGSWDGLDRSQFKQVTLNTWNQKKTYSNLPNPRPGTFFNILPSPKVSDTFVSNYDIERYYDKSLYCHGGTDIDVSQLLADGELWWRDDNEPANKLVGIEGSLKPYRLATVAEAVGCYFNSQEFKSRGQSGILERHKIVIFQYEYVGKEINDLLDPDLPENHEAQIEDEPTQPYLRHGFNPVLMAQYLTTPGIVEALGVASPRALELMMEGRTKSDDAAASPSQLVLSWLRRGTRYNEMTGECIFDGAIREIDNRECRASRLVQLTRQAHAKALIECKTYNASLDPHDPEQRKPLAELAFKFGLIDERQMYTRDGRELARRLLNPLTYFDDAKDFLTASFCQEVIKDSEISVTLTADDAIAHLENYLGITAYKKQSAANVKALHDGRRERREKQKEQKRAIIIDTLRQFSETLVARGVLPDPKIIEALHKSGLFEETAPLAEIVTFILLGDKDDILPIVHRHISHRARLDPKQFKADMIARVTGGTDRRRDQMRLRKRHSRERQKQTAQPISGGDDDVLRSGAHIDEGRA